MPFIEITAVVPAEGTSWVDEMFEDHPEVGVPGTELESLPFKYPVKTYGQPKKPWEYANISAAMEHAVAVIQKNKEVFPDVTFAIVVNGEKVARTF